MNRSIGNLPCSLIFGSHVVL